MGALRLRYCFILFLYVFVIGHIFRVDTVFNSSTRFYSSSGLILSTAVAQADNRRNSVGGFSNIKNNSSAAALLNRLNVPRTAGLYVFDVNSGQEFFSHNAEQPLKPASVLKVVTAAAALEKFGPFHQIPTEVLATGVAGSHVDTLYVKGYGDPILTQEDLWGITRKVYLRGVRSVSKIVVDDSLFVEVQDPGGQRAYEAGVSALSFNYNTISFEVCPLIGQSKALVTHDPREVPVNYIGSISIAARAGSGFNFDQMPGSRSQFPLSFKLGGVISSKAGCQPVARSVGQPALYLGYAFKGLMEKEGIRVGKSVSKGSAPRGAAVVYTHKSKPIKETINLLNTYSNNMIADQLVMLMGKQSDGRHSLAEGLRAVARFLQNKGVTQDKFSLHDGSGLSHSNRITARGLGVVLRDSLVKEGSNVEFEGSLPVAGKSGTLRKRSYAGVARAKTGTINGVVTLAGSVRALSGKKIGFVLLQNQVKARDVAIRLERALIESLRKIN